MHSDYSRLNASAHNTPHSVLDAPALIWHMAYWLPLPKGNNNDVSTSIGAVINARKVHRDSIKKILDDLIVETARHLQSKNLRGDNSLKNIRIEPHVGEESILFERVVMGHEPTWRDLAESDASERSRDIRESDNRHVSIHFELDGIQFSIRWELRNEFMTKTVVAHSLNNCKSGSQFAAPCEILKNYFVATSNAAAKRVTADSAFREDNSEGRKFAAAARKECFTTFWDSYKSSVGSHNAEKTLHHETFRNPFADFRGLVLSETIVEYNDDNFFSTRGGKPLWGLKAEKPLLELATAGGKHECTASYMLDGRAIYMTTLGPQEESGEERKRVPVEYVLYVHQRNRALPKEKIVDEWQLGRLVDRINACGTLRLASLKFLPQLRQVDVLLSGLNELIGTAREAVDTEKSDAIDAIEKTRKFLREIEENFSKGGKEHDGAGTPILYRIERSQYVVTQFHKEVSAIDLKRIGGYQKYDQFVERRLGAAFDFIERLGQRHKRADHDISILEQSHLVVKTNELSKEVLGIQKWGEFVLLFVQEQ